MVYLGLVVVPWRRGSGSRKCSSSNSSLISTNIATIEEG